jgi:3'-phosphoadenosine 5'-phosphosulfate sulfotransferase (PAPS reductase)/FAD synthetase
MKKDPFARYEKETGNRPIVGTMADESRRRKSAWLQTGCNSFDSAKPTSKPMSFWTTQNVLQYVHDYKIPIASVYGDIVADKKGTLSTTGESRTGCIFCTAGCHLHKENRFQRLAKSHPKLHEYCMDALGLGAFLDYVGVPRE